MSISAEIDRLERKYEDLEQARFVALKERTGRAPGIIQEMQSVQDRISALRPFAEPPEAPPVRMVDCGNCGRPFWPESLTDGRCEHCGPPGGEVPSESIQTVKRKGSRTTRS